MFYEKSNEVLQSVQNEQCLVKKLKPLKELKELLSNSTATLGVQPNESDRNRDFVINFITILCESGMVKDFRHEEEIEYERKDFSGVPETAEYCLKCLELFIKILPSNRFYNEIFQHHLAHVLILCATHSEEYLWSSEQTVTNAKNVVDSILTYFQSPNPESLFLASETDNEKIHTNIPAALLRTLRPRLAKNTWKRNPTFKYIFKWVLLHTRHPCLSDHLSDVMPPSLLFIDHHLDNNKVLGIQCLHHIIENVPFTDLKMCGMSDVIYGALHPLSFTSSPPIVSVLYPCLLSFISHLERDSSHMLKIHNRSKYDEIYERLLWNMEMEQKLILRQIYSDHMNQYIKKMGIKVVRHMKKTVRIIIDYMLTYDGLEATSRINACLSLQNLIKVSWPRIPFHCEDILKSLIRCIYDFETDESNLPPEVRNKLLSLCKENLLLLKKTCPDKFVYLLSGLVDKDLPSVFTLKQIINTE